MLLVIRRNSGAVRSFAALALLAAVALAIGFLNGHDGRASGSDTSSTAGIAEAELVNASEGWALTKMDLSWTADGGGDWTPITPPQVPAEAIRSVFFENGSDGWVAALGEPTATGRATLEMYSTGDGGKSWSKARVSDDEQLTIGNISVSFPDSMNGWAMAGEETSAAVSIGHLYATSDGGQSWRALPRPPIAGKIRFDTPTVGWLAGGPTGDNLYRTTDGGSSWTRVSVSAPAGIGGEGVSYGLPRLSPDGSGLLPVTFNGNIGETSVGIYSTSDGGSDWTLLSQVPLKGSIGAGANPPDTAFLGPDSVVVEDPGSTQLMRVDTAAKAGHSEKSLPATGLPAFAPMQFADSEHGLAVLNEEVCREKTDCSVVSKLLLTDDGGESWTASAAP
jgi:photosystem II stability/assembly factor-like uncharacterized protein